MDDTKGRRFRLCWEVNGAEDSIVLTGTLEEIQREAVFQFNRRGIDINDVWSVEEESDD